jgi:hypothetical protein
VANADSPFKNEQDILPVNHLSPINASICTDMNHVSVQIGGGGWSGDLGGIVDGAYCLNAFLKIGFFLLHKPRFLSI